MFYDFTKDFLVQAGYMHTTRVDQPFYFSKRGGVVDIFSMQYDHPIRIDFFDDEIDYINFLMKKHKERLKKWMKFEIIPATESSLFRSRSRFSCYTNQRFF